MSTTIILDTIIHLQSFKIYVLIHGFNYNKLNNVISKNKLNNFIVNNKLNNVINKNKSFWKNNICYSYILILVKETIC
ncbi:hypothetical protein GUU_04584 [Malacoplasma iowae 695]|uniref:Uncharacterized protein n=1 Tax=Malacoplasma iowae 695 TaxID=1048830 RepID=A0A6P1LI44_MALIO|nr:hypothetical protein GUU_04584 [Malacoplasma iowae 695]